MIDLYTYLSKAVDILFDYQWVYNFRATHILVNGTLTQIPTHWVQTLLDLSEDDLSLITHGIVKDGWPVFLSDFVHRSHELVLPHADMGSHSHSKGWDHIPAELQKGMSPKKQHEVLHLTSFIYHQCCESNLSRILDLGSGLGYLGKLLHHRSGYRVLGLEANAGCVGKAVSMQQPICSSGVKHVALTLRPAHRRDEWRSTVAQVRGALEDRGNWRGRCSCGAPEEAEGEVPPTSVCVVSLHSCGDLSPTALRLFLELPQARRLVVMSCCFHKMKAAPRDGVEEDDDDEELFPDFPMSSELERLVRARRSFLRRPLLRLASEMTVEMWRLMSAKQRREHSVHVLGRAVFELYAQRERFKLKKTRRRGVRKTKRSNFEDYLEDALQRMEFVPLCPPPTASDVAGRLSASTESHCPRLAPSSPPVGLCAPSQDIPFIDEDECEDVSRAAHRSPPGECEAAAGVSAQEDPSGLGPPSASGPALGPGHASSTECPPTSDPEDPIGCDPASLEAHRRQLRALIEERCSPEILQLTTALYTLQASIQAVAEGLVIADRLAFLVERGGSSIEASLVRVFDRSVSPRSLAIVARKVNPLVEVNNK